MLRVKKTDGNTLSTSCGSTPQKGTKGEMCLWATKRNDTFVIEFCDIGNYGKTRYHGMMKNLTRAQLLEFIFELETLIHQNDTQEIERLTMECQGI